MKLLRTLLTFIAGTILGAFGQKVAGTGGMVVGSIAGFIVGWWGAKRLMPF
jgi:hypothetical protein